MHVGLLYNKPLNSLSNSAYSTISTNGTLSHDYEAETFGETTETVHELILTRTEMLLLDYKQYKAALMIQKNWRGWSVRRRMGQRLDAALTLQRWWRGCLVRRNNFRRIEETLQQRCIDVCNQAATKIQALFRGWWLRQTVHDMRSLRRMQVGAAEDLLNFLAVDLHALMKTDQLPGIYTMRSSNSLFKVEKLLASLNFRFHNGRVRTTIAERAARVGNARNQFANSRFVTDVPYHGHNVMGVDDWGRGIKDIDKRMFRIIEIYEEYQRDSHAERLKKTLADRRKLKNENELKQLKDNQRRYFIRDVVESVKKWKVIEGEKLYIDGNSRIRPENVMHFLSNVKTYVDELSTTCHCKVKDVENIYCH